jgi:hypothetical protein
MSLNWTQCRVTRWCATDCTCNLLLGAHHHWRPIRGQQKEHDCLGEHHTHISNSEIHACVTFGHSTVLALNASRTLRAFCAARRTQICSWIQRGNRIYILWSIRRPAFLLGALWFGNYDECHPRSCWASSAWPIKMHSNAHEEKI